MTAVNSISPKATDPRCVRDANGSLSSAIQSALRAETSIKVNGIDVPQPLSASPPLGFEYWVANTSHRRWWRGSKMDELLLARGLVHLSRLDALEHGAALQTQHGKLTAYS